MFISLRIIPQHNFHIVSYFLHVLMVDHFREKDYRTLFLCKSKQQLVKGCPRSTMRNVTVRKDCTVLVDPFPPCLPYRFTNASHAALPTTSSSTSPSSSLNESADLFLILSLYSPGANSDGGAAGTTEMERETPVASVPCHGFPLHVHFTRKHITRKR